MRRAATSALEPPRPPAYFSHWVFAFSLIAGIVLGLALTRLQGPMPQSNREPWQLGAPDRQHYMLAIALEYEARGDFVTALNKLIALRPAQDPLQALAEAACDLGSRGYLRDASNIRALRSAVRLYSGQGRAGCAEELLPIEATTSAPTSPSPAAEKPTALPTKMPLPARQPENSARQIAPPPPAPRHFEARPARSFCDPSRPALIEVYVVDYLGRGLPGQRVRVRWGEQEDIFISGLKAEQGDAYADFQMAEGIDYSIDTPAGGTGLGASLRTGSCYSENGPSLKSYRITFVEI